MYRFALTMLISVIADSALAQDYPVHPVPFTDVAVSDNFWSKRLEISREVSLPAYFKRCEEIGLIDNFAVWSTTIPEDGIIALANGATPLDLIVPEPGAGLIALLSGLGIFFLHRRRSR